jgi:hypothetical protein
MSDITMRADDVYFLGLLLGAFAAKQRDGLPFTQTDAANCREASDALKKMVRRQLSEAEFVQVAGEVSERIVDLQGIGSTLSLLRGEV